MPSAPAAYPIDLDDDLTLPDRRRLHVRALARCEEEPIRELDARLSARTRYLRFLSPFPQLPDSLVRLLACVDYRRTLALVVEHESENRPVDSRSMQALAQDREVVALGSFGADEDGNAELALLVRDDWQRQGVGGALAERVLRAAESRGFRRFIVHTHSDNVAIRKLLRRIGRVVWSRASGGVFEVAFVRQDEGDQAT